MDVTWDDFPEATFTLPAGPDDPTLAILIAKVGGGTVGRSYTGRWQGTVTCAGQEVYRYDDLYTNQACTHLGAARHLADFLSTDHTSGPDVARRMDAWASEA